MTKRIGILGGISAASTSAYYDELIKRYYERRHDYSYPEIVIFSLNFQRFTDLEDSGDREGYVAEIITGVTALEGAGVDFMLMAANSPHAVFGEVERRAAVPLLSIVEVTADAAAERGMGKLLLLGIRFTMESTFYQEACESRGISVVVPSREEQDRVNAIIFDELARSIVEEDSRRTLLSIIERYPVDGVILGCTELPLILKQEDTAIPLLSTLDLHVEAALDYALT